MNSRLKKILRDITYPPFEVCWLDTYNQNIMPISGTITSGYNKRNLQFIMEKETPINTTSDNARTITTQYGKKGWSAMLDSDRDSLTCVQNSETYRIRKLTPRECFRLMGVSESEIDTIQAANLSDTRQYFLAGNSIVVDVLEGIFRKMFVDKEITELKLF